MPERDTGGIDIVNVHKPFSEPPKRPEQKPKKTYNLSDTAAYLGWSQQRVKKAIHENDLPLEQLPNGRYSIKESDLVRWNEQRIAWEAEQARNERRSIIIGIVVGILLVAAILACLFYFKVI